MNQQSKLSRVISLRNAINSLLRLVSSKRQAELRKKHCIFLIFLLIFLLPAFWYCPGQIIGKGDSYPFTFQIGNLNNDLSLWSSSNLGNPSPSASSVVLGLIWNTLETIGLEADFLQTAYLMFCFGMTMISSYFFTRTIYPESAIAGVVAGIFYVFNFFFFSIILNIGMMWTYAWLPLLMALLAKVLTQKTNTIRNCIVFASLFSVVASFASINLANVVLLIIGLGAVYGYHVVFNRKMLTKQLIKVTAALLILTPLLSIWWFTPNINYYMPSTSSQMQPDVNVYSWSWSHQRASLLNLISLNAGWGWRAEYTPYYQSYSDNMVLMALMLVPFFFACSALLFKQQRKTSLYLLLLVLVSLFLAKGLHEPFSFVNSFLYNSIPFMSMFREPVSKFTLVALPFLAVLIGYAASKTITRVSSKFPKKPLFSRGLLSVCLVLVLASPVFPLISNPLETKTQQIPYSSYVQIPQYWYETNLWLNNQPGDFRVLLTPPDDFYQMPYVWGYYGTDSLIEKLIEKPVISATCAYSYKTNPNMVALINRLNEIIENNKTSEFKTFLNVLNIKYVIQRNDIDYTYLESIGRHVPSSEKMKNFLSNQNCLSLVNSMGALDIYACNFQPHPVRMLPLQADDEYNLGIVEHYSSNNTWSFNSPQHLNEWKNWTLEQQFGSSCAITIDDGSLKFEIMNSTWGWKVLNSPLIDVNSEAKYEFLFKAKGKNAYEPHVKIFEFNSNMELISAEQFALPIDKSSEWITFDSGTFSLQENTQYIQLQIWSGHASTTPLPNVIWIEDFEVRWFIEKINPQIQTMLETTNAQAEFEVIKYDRLSPSKITAEINASNPFTLLLSEAYDEKWEAQVNGKIIQPISVFSLNGFNIDQTGLSTVIIEYKPQKWFDYGLAVSAVTLLGCIAILLFTERKKRQINGAENK